MFEFICWQFDDWHVLYLLSSYILIVSIFNHKQKKEVLASSIISCFTCWKFIIDQNTTHLIQYYWYDLILVGIKLDWLMIAHHLFTIYGISHCTWYLDYDNIITILKVMKISDVLIYQYKITNALELEKHFPVGIRIYQCITHGSTCILWFVLRIIYILTLFPFETLKANSVIPIFLVINFYWIIKLSKLTTYILQNMYSALLV